MGWSCGLIENKGKKEVVEVYDMREDLTEEESWAWSSIYIDYEDIDNAISYFELLVRDLKRQKEAKVVFKVVDGDLKRV